MTIWKFLGPCADSDGNWDFSVNLSHNALIRHCEVFDAESAEDRGNRGTWPRMDERPWIAADGQTSLAYHGAQRCRVVHLAMTLWKFFGRVQIPMGTGIFR